jgi:hypothetical protein
MLNSKNKSLNLSPSHIIRFTSNKYFIFLSFTLLNLVTVIIVNSGVIPIEYGIKSKSNLLWLFSLPLGAWVSSSLFLFLLKTASFHYSTVLSSIRGNLPVLLMVLILGPRHKSGDDL